MNAMPAALVTAPPSTWRLLIVDDDDVDRERCVRYLRQIPDRRVEVVAVASVAAAEAELARQRFDCVLADYRLPGQSGLDLAGRHRGEGEPPIILLTGIGSESVVLEALRSGVVDYLGKSSLTPAALHRAIGNAVEKAALRDSLSAHTQELEKANRTLKRRNSEIQRFYHSVSHELKTPLTAAREFVALVVDGVAGGLNDEQRGFLLHAIDCCDQLVMHFNDLVETTRLETGKLRLVRSGQRIEKIVVRALFSVSAQASARSIDLRERIEPDLPAVDVDGGRILQVLANLLTNAIKFTAPGGHVELSVRRAGDGWLEIAVSDNGCGIESEHLEHIFERLYQVPGSGEHATGDGLGLGLAIASEIVELHGSRLQVRSEPGRGSTFHFTLPAAIRHTAPS